MANFSAEDLNTHFASVSYNTEAPSVERFLKDLGNEEIEGRFNFAPVTPDDVMRAIRGSTSQAVGVNDLPQSFIKSALPSIMPFICNLFNKSLSSATFPDRWKQSIVIALNKTATPGCLGDFRPISLLCFLSKILERIVHDQISAYVETRDFTDKFQSAYRPGHSTQTALLRLTDDIRRGKDRRLLTALILFDFSKAFDSVCHVTLLRKLNRFGFSQGVLRWIASYLSCRAQAVRGEDGSLSSFRSLNRGLPQGSVLGPLLFSLFIRDITQELEPGVSHIVFADDLQIYVQGAFEDLQNTLRKLGTNALRISRWAEDNGLKLNVSKTQAIIFGTPVYVNRLEGSGVTSVPFGDSEIEIVPSVRSLGVVLDAKMNWKLHISSICKRANSLLYRLNQFRCSTNLELRVHLIQSLLFPIVDYCSLAYCDISGELNLKLQRVINMGIRYIYGIRKADHITPYRRELGWLTVKGRRDYFAGCLLYTIFATGRPTYLAEFFIANLGTRPVRKEECPPLLVPSYRLDALGNSFQVSSARLWNALPPTIRSSSSLLIFKHQLETYIFMAEGEQL